MIYLYFDLENRKLYVSEKLTRHLEGEENVLSYDNIDSVSADKERGQICAHTIGKGIVVEFPIGRTSLSCQRPKLS